ncbi:hypothetical protein LP419_14695 [Massilia sp. H-1]|nr:hypothetical protein LP419_14695 [Massilia sp. H-1]
MEPRSRPPVLRGRAPQLRARREGQLLLRPVAPAGAGRARTVRRRLPPGFARAAPGHPGRRSAHGAG